MAFRDEREALRARAERAEAELAALKATPPAAPASEAPSHRAPAARLANALFGVGVLLFLGGVGAAAMRPEPPLGPLLAALAMLGLTFVPLALVVGRLRVVAPNELLVVSGRRQLQADGTTRGYRLVRAGRTLLVPLLEREEWLSLDAVPVDFEVRNAYAAGGRSMSLEGTAMVRFDPSEPRVYHAVERFLGRGREDVRVVAAESIEGALRSVVAQHREPERFVDDRLALGAALLESGLEADLGVLGMLLETVHLQRVEPVDTAPAPGQRTEA